jgi:hypothetical protein
VEKQKPLKVLSNANIVDPPPTESATQMANTHTVHFAIVAATVAIIHLPNTIITILIFFVKHQ